MLDPNFIGTTKNGLTIVDIGKDKNGHNMYICKCECGNEFFISKYDFMRRKTRGCKACREKRFNYLIGQTINKWFIIGIFYNGRKYMCHCICECGTVRDVDVYSIIHGDSKDCGCGRKKMLSETKSSNLVGQRFGKLLVIEKLPSDKFQKTLYRCICDCGGEIVVEGCCLTSGHTLSCGCLSSAANLHIRNLLNDMHVQYKPEKVVRINNVIFRFDFYLPYYNLMIEYDGEQHYKPVNFGGISDEEALQNLRKTQTYDHIKNNYCKENNINLLRIPYWEKKNIDIIINDYLQRLNEKGLAETA